MKKPMKKRCKNAKFDFSYLKTVKGYKHLTIGTMSFCFIFSVSSTAVVCK